MLPTLAVPRHFPSPQCLASPLQLLSNISGLSSPASNGNFELCSWSFSSQARLPLYKLRQRSSTPQRIVSEHILSNTCLNVRRPLRPILGVLTCHCVCFAERSRNVSRGRNDHSTKKEKALLQWQSCTPSVERPISEVKLYRHQELFNPITTVPTRTGIPKC